MNLVSLAQQMADAADQSILFDKDACLHSLDKFSNCDHCYEICPATAIQPGSPPVFDEEFCQTCQACLPVCPSSAYSYSGIDTVNAILSSITRQNLRSCDLCCGLNPNVEQGPAGSSAGLRVRGCLAGIGLGGYMSLLSAGLESLYVRVDACHDCPWSMLYDEIDEQADHSHRLLELWGRESSLLMTEKLDNGDAISRPYWNAEAPPRSLRDLVQSMPAADTENMVESGDFRERIRVIRAVGALRNSLPIVEADNSLEGMGFAVVQISDECTACGTCGRACPTNALTFENTKKNYTLSFSPESCIGCDICEHVCAPQAITIDHTPTAFQVFGQSTSLILQEGDLAHCSKCHAPFAAKSGSQFCPICEYRRKNPFGSVLPPIVKKRRQEGQTSQ